MNKRNASASIQGYDYQLLHTFIDILETDVNDAWITIEGIEDLDIENKDSLSLIQYKYHEMAKYVDSKVAKPIGLMFDHFLSNEEDEITYHLYIYLDDELPKITKERLTTILTLKSATDYYDECKLTGKKQDILFEKFGAKLSWKKTDKYDALLRKLESKVRDTFHITNDEAEFVVIPNGLRLLMGLAISKQAERRRIKKAGFVECINSTRNIVSSSLLMQYFGKEKFIKFYKTKLKALSITKNGSDYVLFFNNVKRQGIEDLILTLSKQFFYKGNKKDFKPVTFILNCSVGEIESIKAKIAKQVCLEGCTIKFNDGYERYSFNHKILNEKPITTNSPNNSKVNAVNYNFKIITYDTYIEHRKCIDFINPFGIVIDNRAKEIPFDFSRIVSMDNFENDDIFKVIGGC